MKKVLILCLLLLSLLTVTVIAHGFDKTDLPPGGEATFGEAARLPIDAPPTYGG